jgi:hypothetical protein
MNLDRSVASRFALVALGHVTRQYPNKLDHVIDGAEDLVAPRELHPIFYGSFDWHSCVHSYWLLARVRRLFPDLTETPRITGTIDRHLTSENVDAELAYLRRPSSGTFERPYGWGWLLALAAELLRDPSDEGRRWARALAPLAEAFVERFRSYLPRATYPGRAGTHGNTAFALALALEYADGAQNAAFARELREKAIAWYSSDLDCQAWEPSGDDFLSPSLVEAECMRRSLPPDAFARWLEAFLPMLDRGRPETLFEPAVVTDRSDGKIVHLDGLNLSRAWCFRSLATAVEPGDPRRGILEGAAARHLAESLPRVTGDYMGEHWLATYAMLALE